MARKVKGVYNKQTPVLADAIEAVKSKRMSLRKAADHYGVKKSTLSDHVSGKIKGKKSGRGTVFTAAVEQEIVRKAHVACQQGFGISRKQLLKKAGQLAKSMKLKTPFKNGIPGQAWWDGFRGRNPDLVLRKSEKLSSTRARNLNRPVVDDYFNGLERSLNELNLKTSPDKIWNMDETNLSMEHSPPKKCAKKGVRSVPGLVSNSRESVTVVGTISADGRSMPPMVIVKGKTEKSLNGFNRAEGPTNAVWHFQANAWIDEAGCLKWFREVFLQNCGPARPQILILDRHSSHESIDLLEAGIRDNIRIIGLPAHTTHFLCPLDRTVFGPFKKHYNSVCDEFTSQSPSNLVMKWNFPKLCHQAFELAFTARNITSGFKSCGIIPFNPSVIPEEAFMPAEPTNTPIEQEAIASEPILSNTSRDVVACTSSLPSASLGAPTSQSVASEMQDGDNPEMNLELLSQIALNDAYADDSQTTEYGNHDEDLLSIALLLGDNNTIEPSIIELPITLPPPNNTGDNASVGIVGNQKRDATVTDDPLWSSTMIISPLKPQSNGADWNSEISNIFSVPSCGKEPAVTNSKNMKKKSKKSTGHKILTSEDVINEKKMQKEKKESLALKKQINAENRKKKALELFLKKMK